MRLQPVVGVRSTIGTTAQAHACEQTLQSTVGGPNGSHPVRHTRPTLGDESSAHPRRFGPSTGWRPVVTDAITGVLGK